MNSFLSMLKLTYFLTLFPYLHFRPILWNIGIWDTVRVDHGLETSLLLHVQDMLSDFRTNTRRRSVVQSPSTKVISRQFRFLVESHCRTNLG